MPTSYTSGIIDGKTETFQDFAKQCMKAFGACIHMRDENMNKEYEPRIPSDYHTKAIERAKEKLQQSETLTDDELIELRTKELKESIKYHLDRISAIKSVRVKLDLFLSKAIEFKAPTNDHEGYRKFMIEQLQSTIECDGKTDYHDRELSECETEINNINVNEIRLSLSKCAKEDISYHQSEYESEVKRCNTSNAWVESVMSCFNCA